MDHDRHQRHQDPMGADRTGRHGDHRGAGPASSAGLAVADAGRRLLMTPAIVDQGQDVPLTLRVVEAGGGTVTSFDELHERRMHLIVVRRDLSGFHHLHPGMDPDGTWRTNVTFPSAGAWRAFADFSVAGVPTTLGVDVLVRGDFQPQPLPDQAESVDVSGQMVSLRRGTDGIHRFTIQEGGRSIRPEPYLGALGHLVALRWGDLAFLHVHPTDEDEIAFDVTYPSPGTYRLFLQYQVEGEVRTAGFTTAADEGDPVSAKATEI